MLVDRRDDVQGYSEGATSVFQWDRGAGSLSHRFEERFQLCMQGFFLRSWRLRHLDLRIRRRPSVAPAVANAEDQDVLPAVIERHILLWLKKSQLTHTFG